MLLLNMIFGLIAIIVIIALFGVLAGMIVLCGYVIEKAVKEEDGLFTKIVRVVNVIF